MTSLSINFAEKSLTGVGSHQVRIARSARRDLIDILEWTAKEFGELAALRYDALLKQALRDISEVPERPGSMQRAFLKGSRTYHISLSRQKTTGVRVKDPCHFLLYRFDGRVVEILRILHDARDLARLATT